VAYDLCGPRLCVATAGIDAKFLSLVKASKKAVASYVQASRKLVQANLDLARFSEAYDYLVQQLA
jgi:invasion protein IalB